MSESLEALSKFRPLPRAILQILGVCEEIVHIQPLLRVLSECGWRDATSKSGRLTHSGLKPVLKELVDARLVKSRYVDMRSLQIAEPWRDICVQDALLSGSLARIHAAVEQNIPEMELYRPYSFYGSRHTKLSARRKARLAFYQGDLPTFQSALKTLETDPECLSELNLLNPFDERVYRLISEELQPFAFLWQVADSIFKAQGSPERIRHLREFIGSHPQLSDDMLDVWINTLIASGDLQGLGTLAERPDRWGQIAGACLAFQTGQHDAALTQFEQLTAPSRSRKKGVEKPNTHLPTIPRLLHLLLLSARQDLTTRSRRIQVFRDARKELPGFMKALPEALQKAVRYQDQPDASTKEELECTFLGEDEEQEPLMNALLVHIAHWFHPYSEFRSKNVLKKAESAYARMGLDWLAAICEDAVAVCQNPTQATPGQRHAALGTKSLLSLIERAPVWKRKLEALRALAGQTPAGPRASAEPRESDERLIWEVHPGCQGRHTFGSIEAFAQKFSGGTWSKGRPVSLKRLYTNHETPEFGFLTEQDHAVCRSIEISSFRKGYSRYQETIYDVDYVKALMKLIGHPLVFPLGNRSQPMEVTAMQPQLRVTKTSGGIQLQIDPKPPTDSDAVIISEGSHRIVIVRFSPEEQKLAEVLEGAMEVPESSSAEFLETIRSLSALMAVQSDISLNKGATGVSTRKADPQPLLQLIPLHAGVRAEFFVQPFGGEGPLYPPGEGSEHVFAELNGQAVSIQRDLPLESDLMAQCIAACPSLARFTHRKSRAFELSFADDALQLLLEIEPLRTDKRLVVQWPQGQNLVVAGTTDTASLRLRIERDNDWFAASGQLQVDEEMTLDLMYLLDFVSASPSRFVKLSDDRYVALTDLFRQRILELKAYSDREGQRLRLPPIRAAALLDLNEWSSLKADRHWKSQVQKIRQAEKFVAEVPSTLQAELRDYQVEGFRWLCRLAHWGAGACLADDMGLGKTVQTIAMLLHRGAGGPALVIAPTSVCYNWESELQKFAPTLVPHILGASDREAILDAAGPRDVIIASYGLLLHEFERLQSVAWHSAILDEAQAVKNMLSKRSQAAMLLKADFRMILTGTPIENHLGELWNLFQFINPGLLGTPDQFQQRFATPIERERSQPAREQLKRLIQPFLLRRTKTQVLSELPSRTEVVVPVTLPEEEAALYEAARRQALQELTEQTQDQRGLRIRILAHIMQLRRACCHPRLLLPDTSLPGAKLTAFRNTIQDLLENHHKALVFSQFVDHLSILRQKLDQQQIKYQYLDGSTPMKERQKSVEAFQNGEGDLFLISLRAGGSGLNLTAADYVLHMDPWWNPAVEDQATDRAHRMGQQRPVTIYRYITRGTIEEKILDLHSRKRDLADSLLEGADLTARLTAEELLALLR